MDKKHTVIVKSQVLKLMRLGEWKGVIDSVLEEGCNAVNTKKINGYTLLSCAAECGDKQIVEYLMQKGANSNATNFNRSTPLHIAAKHGHVDLVEYFLNVSICVDSRDCMNRTPLHYVTDQLYANDEHPSKLISGYDKVINCVVMGGDCPFSQEHTELVSLLLRHGADMDARDSLDNFPLFNAVNHNCTDVVEMLIKRGAFVDLWDDDHWTVLHYASYFGWLNVVQCLVERRVDLNAETLRGDTPLLLAAKRSHEEVVELLVQSGADVSHHGMLRRTLLHYASQEGWLDVVQLIVERKADINARTCSGATPVMLAVKYEHSEVFDYLVKCGAGLVGSEGKTTILHYASEAGWVDAVQSLVDLGSDINAQTSEGDTPLFMAARLPCKKICDILIKSGANLNISDSDCNSLLHIACKNDWIEIVQRCIDAGLDINAKNMYDMTPLMLAASRYCNANRYCNVKIVNRLLEAGADFKVKRSFGWTALHDACDSESLETVSALLSKGANVNVKSSKGHTPLTVAVRCGYEDIVIHLLEAGADVNVKTASGKTPLYLAVTKYYMEIAAHLLKFGANCNEDIGHMTPFELYGRKSNDLKYLNLFIENGAFITPYLNDSLWNNSYYKENILKNVGICKQAILNKFNNSDLPKIYQVPFAVKSLPPMKGLEIVTKSNVAKCIEESVVRDIEKNGFCDISAMQPIVLSLLSSKAFIDHYI